MSSWGKITRILWKTILFSVLLIVILCNLLFVALQTEMFQTWSAQKLTAYLSKELNADLSIERVKISLISNVTLEGVFVSDKHHDTLVYGKNITVDVSGFNYKTHQLKLDEVELTDIKVKLLKYKNEEDWNFQYLADYFSSSDTTITDTTKSPWKIYYGDLKLNNVDFTYRLLRDTNKIFQNMNYRNIHVSNIYGTFTDIDFKGDTIYAQINNLRAKEQCGIELKHLTTRAKVSSAELRCDSIYLKTPNSFVQGNLQFKYDQWEDYQDFVDKVYIKGNLIDSTFVSFKDIAYFAEDINGFDEVLHLTGKVRGYVNDLSGSNLNVNYREHTQFIGDASITGLPDFEKSFIHFDAKKLSTSKVDLEKFPIPPFDKPTHLNLPKELENLGVISYRGKFDGFVNDFVTYGTFKTNVGSLKTDLQVKNNKNKLIEYSGSIATTNFDLSKLFPNVKFVGPISLSSKVKGKGLKTEELDAEFDGMVQAINYNNYQYDNVKIDGLFKNEIFKGNVASRDTNANFDFMGSIDFNNKLPKMDFISTINNFDLEKTHFSTPQLNGKVSSQILINLNGNSIDNLSGQINFDNTIYKTIDGKINKLSSFNLDLDQSTEIKNIKLNSNIANVQLSGEYNLSSLPNAFKQYLNEYFPTFVKTKTRYIYSDKADLKVKIKNYTIVKEIFTKDLMIGSNSLIEGSFDASINYLYLKTNSDLIEYSGVKFKGNNIAVNSLTKGVKFTYNSKAINVSDSFAFKNPSLAFVANDKVTDFNLNWDNLVSPNNAGIVSGKAIFEPTQATVLLDKIRYVVEDSIWQIVKYNPITIDTSFAVKINSLTFYNQNQLITIDGVLSNKSNDKVDVLIQNFKLAQLNPFLKDAKLFVEGNLTGTTSVLSAFSHPLIISEIGFSDLKLNNKLIGFGEIKSEYNPQKEHVSIDGYSAFAKDFDGNLMKNITFRGYYYPKRKEESLDISFKAEPFDLSLLQPYFKDIFTVKIGNLIGNGTITGTLDEPQINAKLKFFKCSIVIDYTNVQYVINGDVEIMPKQIRFDNILVQDVPFKGMAGGNPGNLSGNIFHNNFKDMRIDFDLNTNKLMVLNTTAANNPSYYGTAYASGNAGIYGFVDDIKMELNLKTSGGTYFYIPLDGPSEVGNNDFIKFVTKDTVKTVVKKTKSNFSLDFNLEATKDAEVQLIFDEKSGDIIKARGDGILNMKIDSRGKFDMFGDYVLSTGDYLFTLENFVTKKFEIQKGSSIKWNGNVYKANIDIVANYKQRASIKPLFPNDSVNNYNKRFPVDCKLYMKDKLTSPDITFGIELPTIDENTRSAIKSLLNDENELNRQVFSLLLLRSFVTPVSVAGSGGISAGGAAAATGSEMLSNKMSNWLNGITKDIDIGVNYRPGGTLSSDELDLALSKQLFNNRLTIDGNFGVANNNTAATSTSSTKNSNTSNLIGDVTLEYKLSESGKYRVKAFNRSNDNTEIATSGGPFTQGVGVFYREEYESLSELYKRYISKLKRNKTKK